MYVFQPVKPSTKALIFRNLSYIFPSHCVKKGAGGFATKGVAAGGVFFGGRAVSLASLWALLRQTLGTGLLVAVGQRSFPALPGARLARSLEVPACRVLKLWAPLQRTLSMKALRLRGVVPAPTIGGAPRPQTAGSNEWRHGYRPRGYVTRERRQAFFVRSHAQLRAAFAQPAGRPRAGAINSAADSPRHDLGAHA